MNERTAFFNLKIKIMKLENCHRDLSRIKKSFLKSTLEYKAGYYEITTIKIKAPKKVW